MTTAPGGPLGVLCYWGPHVVLSIHDSRRPKESCFVVPGVSLWLKLTHSENDVSPVATHMGDLLTQDRPLGGWGPARVPASRPTLFGLLGSHTHSF